MPRRPRSRHTTRSNEERKERTCEETGTLLGRERRLDLHADLGNLHGVGGDYLAETGTWR